MMVSFTSKMVQVRRPGTRMKRAEAKGIMQRQGRSSFSLTIWDSRSRASTIDGFLESPPFLDPMLFELESLRQHEVS